jgi:hypothetical protein
MNMSPSAFVPWVTAYTRCLWMTVGMSTFLRTVCSITASPSARVLHTQISLIKCFSDHENVILFSRQPAECNEKFINHFSVMFPGQTSVKSRVIVSHCGENSGSGIWSCTKDRGSSCGHITIARHHLQKLLQADPNARDHGAHESPVVQIVPGAFLLPCTLCSGSYIHQNYAFVVRRVVANVLYHIFLFTLHLGHPFQVTQPFIHHLRLPSSFLL